MGTIARPAAPAAAQDPALSNLVPRLVSELGRAAPRISQRLLALALRAASCAKARNTVQSPYLAIIDYSLPSTSKRFWLFDLEKKRLLREELIAHGKESGLDRATHFSNEPGSLQSSIGLFSTGGTYIGQHGYSMYLHGLEKGFNDQAYNRAIVMHGAPYVSESFVDRWNRLGRSWGCPALSVDAAPKVINYLKDGALLFAYYPDEQWLERSKFLNGCEG